MVPGNKRVVLTRSPAGNKTWAAHLATHGIPTYSLPTISTQRVRLTPELKRTFENLDQFDWIIFTSAAGVHYAQALGASPTDAARPAVAVVGDRTAASARQAGWRINFQPSLADAATLAKELSPIEGRNIVILQTNIATDELAAALRRHGATVTNLAVYQTKLRSEYDPALSQLLAGGDVLCLTFASPSAVRGFTNRLTPADLALAMSLPAVAIGPRVAESLNQAGFANIHVAARPDVESIREAILAIR